MNNEAFEFEESLIRVRTVRRGNPVELRVHYAVSQAAGCLNYQILTVEEQD